MATVLQFLQVYWVALSFLSYLVASPLVSDQLQIVAQDGDGNQLVVDQNVHCALLVSHIVGHDIILGGGVVGLVGVNVQLTAAITNSLESNGLGNIVGAVDLNQVQGGPCRKW